jgi:DNA repair protein RecN (Recombination protein N)
MLQWLKIKNLALVEDAEIEFDKGFNIISGETGSGKSVIINAISLLLGKRADKTLIRTGKNRCELTAGILLSKKSKLTLKTFFEKNDIILEGNELLLRKVITPTSSRNYINDTSVTLNILNSLGSVLIDFHGPNQHQSLLKPALQLEILDRHGCIIELREECKNSYIKLKTAENELKELNQQLPDAIEAEHLRKIIREIEAVNLSEEEVDELTEQFKLASNSKEILQLTYEIKNILQDSEDSLLDKLNFVNKELFNLAKFDNKNSEEFIDRVTKISDDINELSIDLDTYSSNIEIDEEEYFLLEEKINNINSLKRRYGPTIENVNLTLKKAQEKIEKLDNFEALKAQLDNNVNILRSKYNSIAQKLSRDRKTNSKKFSTEAKNSLIKLGFLKADISVDFQPLSPSPTGIDKIEILFCPNPGEESLPLRNIASSGEISRVMLAIKTVLSDADNIPILIFDEIDANIGGEVAHQVGGELHKLATKHHVLCISHLAQVASFADSHFKVDKEVIGSRTFSKIEKLNKEEQIKEIGRMLGGGKAAENHAKEMLS